MSNQAVEAVPILDEWKAETPDGTTVRYSIIGTQASGFVYSATSCSRSLRVSAPQGPLSRDRVEALFADTVKTPWKNHRLAGD